MRIYNIFELSNTYVINRNLSSGAVLHLTYSVMDIHANTCRMSDGLYYNQLKRLSKMFPTLVNRISFYIDRFYEGDYEQKVNFLPL